MINQIKPSNYSNPQIFSPVRNNIGLDYAITKPVTDEQRQEVEKEKDKKSNALGFSIATTALIGGFGVLALMKGLPKGARLNLERFFKYLETKTSAIKNNNQLTTFQKFTANSLEKVKKAAGMAKGIFNVGSIKDASFKAAIDKIPFMKKIDESITTTFENISVKTLRNAYSRTLSKFDDLYSNMADLTAKLDKSQQERAHKLISNIKSTYQEQFTAEPRKMRLIDTRNDLKGLHEKVRDRIFKVKEFVKNKETYITFFPEELASGAKNNLQSKIKPSRDEIVSNLNELLELYKAPASIDNAHAGIKCQTSAITDKELAKIQRQTKLAIRSLDKSIKIESEDLFEKLRDLEIGSAPTEILGVFTSLGLVGWGLTKADNKDQRISVGLKYGIPAVGAIVTSLYCTIRLVSGGKSLIFGLLSGAAINKVGEVLDNSRKKYEEHPLDIKTIPNLIINPLQPVMTRTTMN